MLIPKPVKNTFRTVSNRLWVQTELHWHSWWMLTAKLAPVAEPIFEELAKYFPVDYDAAGSIGKRYRREDEIGTPFCICVDFDTETDGCVTIRDRDTMEQVRLPINEVKNYIEEKLIF